MTMAALESISLFSTPPSIRNTLDPEKTSAKLPIPSAQITSSERSIKNPSLSKNPKVEKTASAILKTGKILLSFIKTFFLICMALGMAFVLIAFISHLALALAIPLGILCVIAIIFFLAWGMYELSKPRLSRDMAEMNPQNWAQLPKTP